MPRLPGSLYHSHMHGGMRHTGLYRCSGTIHPHTYPQKRSKSPVTRALSPCRRRQSRASRARPGSSRVPSTEKRPPATENARRWGGSHSSRPEQKQPETKASWDSCSVWARGAPVAASSSPGPSHRQNRGRPSAFPRRASPAPYLALQLSGRPHPRGCPPEAPTVLTSHVQGQAEARQGPPMKQPQSHQGRQAGGQGLTGPQACGQHQGGHKHSPTSKPGGRQGTRVAEGQTAWGPSWTLKGMRGGQLG